MLVKLPRGAFVGGLLALAFLLSPLPASAHHGWGGYVDQLSDISGIVESPLSLAGPHAFLKVRTSDGQVWNVLLAPPAGTERAGLKDGMIPAGANVVVHGQRHRDPKTFEIKTTRLTWNGKTYNVYPDRQ
jgi:uncharacterized protein DUF6152